MPHFSFSMKPRLLVLSLLMSLLAAPAFAERSSLAQGWRFQAGETSGAQRPEFDDKEWQRVSVPHDFSIQDKADGSPPFDKLAIAGADAGYLPGGIGWYRRELQLDARAAAAVLRLEFEAVYMDAEVWLNGEHLSTHHYGYTAFALDLTGKVKPGRNLIAVRVNHPDPSSRWYAGSGIIRPVHLETLGRVHIVPMGTAITTPVATSARGEVSLRTGVANRSGQSAAARLVSTVLDQGGRVVASASADHVLAAGAEASVAQALVVRHPGLWSPASPQLYTLVQELRLGGKLVDSRRTRFGIRSLEVDAEHGIRINGQSVKLKGGNIHHDNYMLGAAGAPDADARKVALLKAAGYNAIRNAHNPASQATLDAADALGMLVIDEAFDAWNVAKRAQDYARFFKADWQADIDSLVRSGRNHPSVIMWSIGNEIPEQATPLGISTARALAARVRQLDPSRPVTQALNVDSPANAGQFAELDVAGYNYRAQFFARDHVDHPRRVMYTAESTSKDAFRYWQPVATMASVVGDFVWTAFDYIGETGIGWMGYSRDWSKLGPYPWYLAYCGEIDASGRKRPAAYYREVLWQSGIDPISAFVRQPAGSADLPDRELFAAAPAELDWSLHDLHPSWTWPGQEGKPLTVEVYAEFPEVELFLNGRSVGRKQVGIDTEYKAAFTVPYTAGTLRALGYRDGKVAGQWELQTAGKPAALRLSVDRKRVLANGEALAYVTAELVDARGVPVYQRDDDRGVTFRVSGAATLEGAGSGNPMAEGSLRTGALHSFHGRAVGVLRAGTRPGPIKVEVEVDSLPVQEIGLQATAR